MKALIYVKEANWKDLWDLHKDGPSRIQYIQHVYPLI